MDNYANRYQSMGNEITGFLSEVKEHFPSSKVIIISIVCLIL